MNFPFFNEQGFILFYRIAFVLLVAGFGIWILWKRPYFEEIQEVVPKFGFSLLGFIVTMLLIEYICF